MALPTKRHMVIAISVGVLAVGAFVAIRQSGQEAGTREEELTYLRAALPEDLLEYASLDIATRDAVSIQQNGTERFLGLRVFPGQPRVHGGVRAEISVDYPFQAGDRIRYAWRFRIPEGFVTDAPANRWWVIGQWHDQPDVTKGETWDDFPSHSPPIVLGVGELDGQLALSLGYGLTTEGRQQQELGPLPIQPGQWHHLAVLVHWSQDESGSVEVLLDESPHPELTARGPNMNNGYQHYWKLGQYRHPEIGTDNRIDVAELRAGPALTPVPAVGL